MDKNLKWPVEINISIPKAKEISILGLALLLGLRLKQASPIHVSGVSTLGLKEFSTSNSNFLTQEKITEMFAKHKAVGFSVLNHFWVDVEQNIPEAWGYDHLYGGDIFVNKNGVEFLVKICKAREKVQFIPIGERHIFHPHARFICLASNI